MIGYERSSLAHRFRSAYRRVHGGLQLHLGIYLSAEEDDVEGEIEPKEENDERTKSAVGSVVIGKMRDINGEQR